jgi:biotin transport system substrate-specific component
MKFALERDRSASDFPDSFQSIAARSVLHCFLYWFFRLRGGISVSAAAVRANARILCSPLNCPQTFAMNQRITTIPVFYQAIWAIAGLAMTICANFLLAYTTNPPWMWLQNGVEIMPLNVSCQVAAVMLVACLGGRQASTLVQLVYLLIGLSGLYAVFHDGGGWGYWRNPSFGYLLGFVPASWLCGSLAFRLRPTIENISMSCASGLIVIHFCGLIYLLLLQILNWIQGLPFAFQTHAMQYSVYPLPSQLMLACATALIVSVLRRLLLY